MHVALIGIGNMGKPMGRNMLRAGHTVTGFDLQTEAMDYIVEHGGKAGCVGPRSHQGRGYRHDHAADQRACP